MMISYLQRVATEMIIGRVSVLLSVVKNVVAIDGPLAVNPLVKSLVEDWLLGQLVLHLTWGRLLVGRSLRRDGVLDVLVVGVNNGTSSKRTHLQRHQWVGDSPL